MPKHSSLPGNRVTTSINLHSRTLDVLKHIKKQRGEAGIMGFFDKLLSTDSGKRNEALKWLMDFQMNILPNSFQFDQETKHWHFILKDAPDSDFPVIPPEDTDKYFFNSEGKVEFYPSYKNLDLE